MLISIISIYYTVNIATNLIRYINMWINDLGTNLGSTIFAYIMLMLVCISCVLFSLYTAKKMLFDIPDGVFPKAAAYFELFKEERRKQYAEKKRRKAEKLRQELANIEDELNNKSDK